MNDSFDITDEIATLPLQEIIDLLISLRNKGFNKLYFDGYNATIEATK